MNFAIKIIDMQSGELTQTMLEQTRQIINQVEKLKEYDLPALTRRENPASWNVLECLAHLNLYGNFYLPQIEKKIKESNTKHEAAFKSGFLGDYFAKSMLPKEKMKKMNTFKDKNPLNSNLKKDVIEEFLNQQIQLLDLLNKSRNVSLNKIKISISITSLIRLKLGDTFRFYINHMIRHMKQIERIELGNA